jgi:hypothetical protein
MTAAAIRASMLRNHRRPDTWGSTVGKHSAPEGASADPIVADALAARSTSAVHHAAGESPVGWPAAPAPERGGLGWPADIRSGDDAGSAPEEPGPPVARRSWRRLLGLDRAA